MKELASLKNIISSHTHLLHCLFQLQSHQAAPKQVKKTQKGKESPICFLFVNSYFHEKIGK